MGSLFDQVLKRWPFGQVIVVRHGETTWNVAGRRQGQLDSPLTDRGRRQVRLMASTIMEQWSSDAVCSSPIGRAVETATPIAAGLGLSVSVVDDLAELHHGDFAGLTSDEIEDRWPGALAERAQQKYTWRFPGGESYADASDRVGRALDVMAGQSWRRPLIVTHEMIGRMVIGRLLGLPSDEALQWNVPHGHVVVIDSRSRTWSTSSVVE